MKKLLLLCILVFSVLGIYHNVMTNGSFEAELSDDCLRPYDWMIGFEGEAIYDSAEWSFDSINFTDGDLSLKLSVHGDDEDTYFLTQILNCNSLDLIDKTIDCKIDIKTETGYGAFAMVIAINPESADTFMDAPSVGGVLLYPPEGSDTFVTIEESFTATGSASYLVAMVMAQGYSDTAWFDDFSVKFDESTSEAGPDTSEVPHLLSGDTKDFHFGITNEIPANQSEGSLRQLGDEASDIGDIVNLFFHIRWNSITGEELTKGHEKSLRMVNIANNKGLNKMLTLDFTHDNPSTIGSIIPFPDGTIIDSLSIGIREAYIAELLALIDIVDPCIIMIGIETSLYHRFHPEDWDNYILLLQEVNEALSARPDIHISAYAILDDIVNRDGSFNEDSREAWEEIMPYCESVAYSLYPELADTTLFADPAFFTRIGEIAPEKPLLIAEYGFRTDSIQGFNEQKQLDFLHKSFTAFHEYEPGVHAVIWYAMHDTPYLGVWDIWFRDAFSTIGLKDYWGTPKLSYIALRKLKLTENVIEKNYKPESAFIEIYPNPFNSQCRIILPSNIEDQIDLSIYSLNGHFIKTVIINSGINQYIWDGRDCDDSLMESGVYIIYARSNEIELTQKVIFIQ